MAVVYKVLGQSAPSATTETTLYTVPAATETIAQSAAPAVVSKPVEVKIEAAPKQE